MKCRWFVFFKASYILVTLAQTVFILLESLLSAKSIKASLGFMFFWTYLLCLPCFCLLLWLKEWLSFPNISEIAFFWSHFLARKLSFTPNHGFSFFPLPTSSPTPFTNVAGAKGDICQCRWPQCTDLIHCPSCRFSEQSHKSWFGFFISHLVDSYPLQFCSGKVS